LQFSLHQPQIIKISKVVEFVGKFADFKVRALNDIENRKLIIKKKKPENEEQKSEA
jgi:hypothetical protein